MSKRSLLLFHVPLNHADNTTTVAKGSGDSTTAKGSGDSSSSTSSSSSDSAPPKPATPAMPKAGGHTHGGSR